MNRFQLLRSPISSLQKSTQVGRGRKAARQGRGPQDTPSPNNSDAEMEQPSNFAERLDKLFERFDAFEASFGRSFQSLKNDLQEGLAAFRAELTLQTTQQVEAVKVEVMQQVQVNREEAQRLRADFSTLQDKYAGLESRVEGGDRAARAANIFIHGLTEEAGDEHARICSMFPAVQEAKIVEATRLGRPTGTTGRAGTNRPRPVRVRFANVQSKHQALQAGRDLRSRQVYVDVDLTPLQQQAKRAKRDRYLALKQQGLRPFWKAERLYFNRDGGVFEDVGQPTPVPNNQARPRSQQTPLPHPPRFVPTGSTSRSYRDATAPQPASRN